MPVKHSIPLVDPTGQPVRGFKRDQYPQASICTNEGQSSTYTTICICKPPLIEKEDIPGRKINCFCKIFCGDQYDDSHPCPIKMSVPWSPPRTRKPRVKPELRLKLKTRPFRTRRISYDPDKTIMASLSESSSDLSFYMNIFDERTRFQAYKNYYFTELSQSDFSSSESKTSSGPHLKYGDMTAEEKEKEIEKERKHYDHKEEKKEYEGKGDYDVASNGAIRKREDTDKKDEHKVEEDKTSTKKAKIAKEKIFERKAKRAEAVKVRLSDSALQLGGYNNDIIHGATLDDMLAVRQLRKFSDKSLGKKEPKRKAKPKGKKAKALKKKKLLAKEESELGVASNDGAKFEFPDDEDTDSSSDYEGDDRTRRKHKRSKDDDKEESKKQGKKKNKKGSKHRGKKARGSEKDKELETDLSDFDLPELPEETDWNKKQKQKDRNLDIPDSIKKKRKKKGAAEGGRSIVLKHMLQKASIEEKKAEIDDDSIEKLQTRNISQENAIEKATEKSIKTERSLKKQAKRLDNVFKKMALAADATTRDEGQDRRFSEDYPLYSAKVRRNNKHKDVKLLQEFPDILEKLKRRMRLKEGIPSNESIPSGDVSLADLLDEDFEILSDGYAPQLDKVEGKQTFLVPNYAGLTRAMRRKLMRQYLLSKKQDTFTEEKKQVEEQERRLERATQLAARRSAKALKQYAKLQASIDYKLSNTKYIQNWPLDPEQVLMQQLTLYKGVLANPDNELFKKNEITYYDTGEVFATADIDGNGKIFYRSGYLAIEYTKRDNYFRYNVFSDLNSNPKLRAPQVLLGTFDGRGDGVVFSRAGDVRIKYNQKGGQLIDKTVGTPHKWSWNLYYGPGEMKLIRLNRRVLPPGAEINRIIPKLDAAHKKALFEVPLQPTECPLQTAEKNKIRPIHVKLNDQLTLRVISQDNIKLQMVDGNMRHKIYLGMKMTTRESGLMFVRPGQIFCAFEEHPPKTSSIIRIQAILENAHDFELLRLKRGLEYGMPPSFWDRTWPALPAKLSAQSPAAAKEDSFTTFLRQVAADEGRCLCRQKVSAGGYKLLPQPAIEPQKSPTNLANLQPAIRPSSSLLST